MVIKHLYLYYFSGTGNSLATANWIADEARNEVAKVYLINIGNKQPFIAPEKNSLIGFCYPTHGFNAPPIVLKFICSIRSYKKKNVGFFLVNTRAGMKMGKTFLPGLSGIALYLPALMLRMKGFQFRGFRPIDLPSNWIFLHPGIKESVVDSMFTHYELKTRAFTKKMLNGNIVWRGIRDVVWDLLISPVSIGYYFIGRYALAKTLFANQQCNRCNACVRNCPVEAIKIVDSRPYWTYRCESCMKCINECPHKAIHTTHGFTLLLWWTLLSIIPFFLLKIPGFKQSFILDDTVYFVIYSAIALLLMFLNYRIMHFLLKFRFFNWLLTVSSMTHYRFWRRYTSGLKRKYQ